MSWWCTRGGRSRRPTWTGSASGHTSELAEVSAGAGLLLLCVFSDEQLSQIADPLAAALPDGAVFASHVTGRASVLRSRPTASAPSRWWMPRSATRPDDITAGRLTVLLGGPPAARARAAEAVRAYADPIMETGELGSALAVKLVNNFLFAANTQVLAEAVGWARTRGGAQGDASALNHMSGGSQASRGPRSGPTWPRSPSVSGRS